MLLICFIELAIVKSVLDGGESFAPNFNLMSRPVAYRVESGGKKINRLISFTIEILGAVGVHKINLPRHQLKGDLIPVIMRKLLAERGNGGATGAHGYGHLQGVFVIPAAHRFYGPVIIGSY